MIDYSVDFSTNRLGPEIKKAYALAKRVVGDDPGYADWPSRVWYDACGGLPLEVSLYKHLYGPGELYDSLGITKPFPPPLDRAHIIHGRGNFCNIRDAEDIPIFDAFIDYLIINNPSKAQDWINRLHAAGTTHINLDISGDYNENLGWAPRYPIPGSDWTKDLTSFSTILDYVITNGFVPIVHLAADGQGYDPNGMTYGWQWGMDNVTGIIQALSKYIPYVLWNTGWDGCFPDWSRDQTLQFLKMLRNAVGPNGYISTEFNGPGNISYCHMGQGAADWSEDNLGMLDAFFIEAELPFNIDGIGQITTRLLGPKAIGVPTDPYYLASLTKDIGIWDFENCAYQAIRKQISEDEPRSYANIFKNFGYSDFGNGLPT